MLIGIHSEFLQLDESLDVWTPVWVFWDSTFPSTVTIKFLVFGSTLPETNISPQQWLEDDFVLFKWAIF